MQNLDITNLLLGALILYRVIRGQLAPKVVRFKPKALVILILVGVSSIMDAFTKQHLTITPQTAALFGLSSLVSAVLFAGLRAWSYRFWTTDAGLVLRQGNWLTVVWWGIGIGGHLLVDRLWTGSSATLLLYLGITLLVQRGCVWWRATQAFPSEMATNTSQQSQSRKHHGD